MDIFIYNYNKKEFFQFPIVPLDIAIDVSQEVEKFDSIQAGKVSLIGLMGNRKFNIESFFPVKDYSFTKNDKMKGMEYVRKIQEWRKTRLPVFIVIPDLDISFYCSIENFQYSVKDGSGDIYYNLNCEEYIIPQVKKINTTKNDKKKVITTSKNKNPKPLNSAYGIVTADYLNVRNGKSTKHGIIGGLSQGTKVKLFRLEGDWWHIYFGNHGGYVYAKYIKEV